MLALNLHPVRGRRLTRGSIVAAPAIAAVAANGWEATMDVPADLTFEQVPLSRQGYDATGAPVAISESVVTTKRVRQPFPNQASLTATMVALSDYVYSTDTISGVTNNSAETSPKPVANWSIIDRRVVGNSLDGVRFVFGARPTSGLIIAFNRLMRLGGVNAVLQIESGVDTLTGAAVVQNVWEWTSANANPALRPSGDGAPNDSSHVICWHNSFAGFDIYGRGNILCDETTADARFHKLHSFVGNIRVQINTKHDVFHADGTRVGGWSYLYGVGQRGEFARYRDAGSGAWKQEYSGAGSIVGTVNTGAGLDPRFTSPAHTTSGPTPGVGGGNYVLEAGSPARGIVFAAPLSFDMTGAARSGTVAAGAYI